MDELAAAVEGLYEIDDCIRVERRERALELRKVEAHRQDPRLVP